MNKYKLYQLFELQEIEYWEDSWNHVGLFESFELAEQFRDQRIAKLKNSFDDENGKFEDWYRWSISPRNLYKKDLEEDVEAIHRLKTATREYMIDNTAEYSIDYIQDLQIVSDLYLKENP